MLRILQYQGTSMISMAIRAITRSKWSHSALLFDAEFHGVDSKGNPVDIYPGMVIEAWADGIFDRGEVRVTGSMSMQHTPGTVVDVFDFNTPLNYEQFEAIAGFACNQIGKRYDWWHVFLFLPVVYLFFLLKWIKVRKTALDRIKAWFCSFLVFASFLKGGVKLLEQITPWEVPPRMIPMSPYLYLQSTEVTK